MNRSRPQKASTVRARNGGVNGWVLLLVGTLPSLALAIPVPAYLGTRAARSSYEEQLQRVDRREELQRLLSPYRDAQLIEQLRALGGSVEAMIPSSGGALQEFGSIRRQCGARGLVLDSIQNVATHETDFGRSQSGAVVVDEVLVQMKGTPEDAFRLVSDLRSEGQPLVVLGFNLDRSNPTTPVFDQELRLGFLRRIPGTTSASRSTNR